MIHGAQRALLTVCSKMGFGEQLGSDGVVKWLTRWSRSTQLLYIGPGYYLDGYVTVCWQVNHLGM